MSIKSAVPRAEVGSMEFQGRWRLALLMSVLVTMVLAPMSPVAAQTAPFDPNQIVFPIVGGQITFIDDFNQPRSGGRTHGAIDLMASGVKGLPVVAASGGVVSWIGSTCCYLAIDHGGGYETWYIHLNNDTPGTDDGLGWGIADGITRGAQVSQGQLIGWVGDSGNAEWVGPHLHFEIRLWDVPLNPYPYLLNAPRLSAPGGPVTAQLLGSDNFTDDDGSPHEADIETLFAQGVTLGCGGSLYCPDDSMTRGQIALFIYRQLELAPVGEDLYEDDDGSIYEEAANAITAVGVGFGCGDWSFCPDQPLLREEMAELLVRTFSVSPQAGDFFHDDDGSPFEAAINALKAAGITFGCNPSDAGEFCPGDPLTRAQMASFFVRSMAP
ncbi:MAG: peptidoglycan DD-metalloendopeptidase family protein [Acidimicrobiia bacterium]